MDPAKHLGNEPSSIVDEVVGEAGEEEVATDDRLGDRQLLLSLVEVKVDVQVLEEARDGIRVLVLFHLDNLDELADRITVLAGSRRLDRSSRNDGGRDEVSEEVRARCLDRVEIRGREEHFHQALVTLALAQVPKDEKRPVQQPCTGLQLRDRLVHRRAVGVVNDIFQIPDLDHGGLPVSRQDV